MSDVNNFYSLSRKIQVTFQKEGIHCYPDAAVNPKLKTNDWDDVSYLAHPHRHMFHFRVTIDVTHNDRDIEFIQFKRWLERLYSNEILQLDYQSCEMIAENLIMVIAKEYPGRNITVEVFEDNENGAILKYKV